MDEYDLYLRGFRPNATEASDGGLSRVFGLEPAHARELLSSLPRVVKRRIPAAEVERYEQALRALGADYELRRSVLRPAHTLLIEGEDDDDPSATLPEHAGASITLPPPKLDPSPAPNSSATWGERLDRATPVPRVAAGREQLRSPWDTSESLAGGAARPPAQPDLRQLPPDWQIPGLQLDGRPDWLVDGPAPVDALVPHEPPELDIASLPPARQRTLQSDSRLTLDPERPSAVGTIAGRELPAGPPRWLRWAIAFGLGLSLLVIVLSTRQCSSLDHRVERALLDWGKAPASSPSAADTHGGPGVRDTADEAETWLESEQNQVANGGKDRARSWVARFRNAGALGVRVGQIQSRGATQIAGELVVTLPHDYQARRGVLLEYRHYLEATFGGFIAEVHDPEDDLLRVAL